MARAIGAVEAGGFRSRALSRPLRNDDSGWDPTLFVIPEDPRQRVAPGPTERRAFAPTREIV